MINISSDKDYLHFTQSFKTFKESTYTELKKPHLLNLTGPSTASS